MAPTALGWIRILIHLTCFTPSPNQGTKGPKLNTSHCIMVLYGVGTFVNISGQMLFKLIYRFVKLKKKRQFTVLHNIYIIYGECS